MAGSAADADATATLIANDVNVDYPGILKRPASEVKDESDLGMLPVTVDVPPLPDWTKFFLRWNRGQKSEEILKRGA